MKNIKILALTAASAIAATGTATAAVQLIDGTLNNGSFDAAITDPGNSTGGTITQTGASGGQRYARNAGGTITIPGWSIASPNGGFWGINHSDSSPASDGLQSVVVNDGATVTVSSGVFAGTYASGDSFSFSAAFGNNQAPGGGQVAYNLRLLFNDTEGTLLDLVATTFQDATASYIPYSGTVGYTGSGATEFTVVATINNNLPGTGQGMLDAVSLSYTAVPEPSSLLLCSFGLLGLLRRKR